MPRQDSRYAIHFLRDGRPKLPLHEEKVDCFLSSWLAAFEIVRSVDTRDLLLNHNVFG
jgi:hypothetical protein